MDRSREIGVKRERVRAYLRQHRLAGLLLTRTENFAWYTAGGDNHILTGAEAGAASLLITPDREYLVAPNNELNRLRDEEVSGLGFEPVEYPWYEAGQFPALVQKLASGAVASDLPVEGTQPLPPGFDDLRVPLLEDEIERYRWLCARASRAMAEAARSIHPGQTEHEVAAVLNGRLVAHGIVPRVTLIATDDRIARYRHPIPSEKRLTWTAMLVTVAYKWGLHACLTRMVHFGPIPLDLRQRHQVVTRLFAYCVEESRPGRPVAEIFRGLQAKYAELGYPDEWKAHHQGGPTGYRPRDYLATPDCPGVLQANQAVAWNPSVAGAKAEDTILITAEGFENLTETPGWPAEEIKLATGSLRVAGILQR
jgi:Xaa-Pro aminopeptidase